MMTVEQLEEILKGKKQERCSKHPMIGKYVIVRTYSAGVHYGYLSQKEGNEVILTEARRMYTYQAAKSISLTGCALYGIKSPSRIGGALPEIWLEAIEIIPVSPEVKKCLAEYEEVEAE